MFSFVCKKVFIKFLIVFMSICLFFSCNSEDIKSGEKIEADAFSVMAYGRNESIYVSWSNIKIGKEKFDFDKVVIEYSCKDSEVKKIDINIKQQKALNIPSLINETEYKIKFIGFINNQSYIKSMTVTPKKIKYNFERVTSIIDGDITNISFTFKELEDSIDNNYPEPDVKDINLYFGTDKVLFYKWSESAAYETVSEIVDTTKAYKKYYAITVNDLDYAYESENFSVRIVNSENIESEPFKLNTKKVSLPIVKINIENFSEKLEILKNKQKIPAVLNVSNCNRELQLQSSPLTIKGRGNSSWNFSPKKSYTIKFENKQNFLGLGNHKSFALIANYFDKTLLRNKTSYDLSKNVFNKMPWSPGAEPVHLFINDVYQGMYLVVESIKIAANRVNIADISEWNTEENIEDYGFILEIDSRAKEEDSFLFITDKKVPFSIKEPDKVDLQEEAMEYIQQKVFAAEKAIYSDDFSNSESENYYGNFINVDSFIDWLLMEELSKNTDSNFYSSCYMWFNPKDKKFWMGPVWDFDLGWGNIKTFGTFEESACGFKYEEKIENKQSEDNWESWFNRLRLDPSFNEKVKNRWNEVKTSVKFYFAQNSNYETLSNLKVIKNDIENNFIRWPILGKELWKSPIDSEKRKTYDDEKDFFIKWKDLRINWLDENLYKI